MTILVRMLATVGAAVTLWVAYCWAAVSARQRREEKEAWR